MTPPLNPPAFPCVDGRNTRHTGLTMRDVFAAHAMQGMLSCQNFMNETCKVCADKQDARDTIAAWAYAQADAMLTERTR